MKRVFCLFILPIFKFISLALLITIIQPITSLAASTSVKGIYSLMRGLDPVDSSVLKLPPYLAGVSIRASWQATEPEEEKMNWNYLDNSLSKVKKANKKAMLRVLPGVNTPDWVYTKGIPTMEILDVNQYHKTYGKKIKMPVLWDTSYLNNWIKFVSQLGAKYNSHDEVVLVHMAGPTWFSAEMHLPRFSPENREILKKAGYTKDKIVSAWKKVIDAYAKSFPDKPLALNIAVPFEEDGAMEEAVRYGIKQLGNRLCIQDNQLSAHHKKSITYRTIQALSKQGVNVGFQMLDSAKDRPERQGSLETSIEQGLKAGAKYFEIYQADIKEQKNRTLFEKLDKKLR